jgi:hypothetical protein
MRTYRHLRAKWILGIAALASLGTALAAAFSFGYITTYGNNGLSQPYAATTSTGDSYSRGVAISVSDSNQNVYSLVQANPTGTSGYQGPYYIVRRTSSGNIDTTFGANGYVTSFNFSSNSSYQFHDLCIDPGTGNIVVVGSGNTSGSGSEGIVERLLPPASGSASASLDDSFNSTGVLTVTTPSGNNNAQLEHCVIGNAGAGNSGPLFVTGSDDVYPNSCGSSSSSSSGGGCSATSGLLVLAKADGSGNLASAFGSSGI